MKLIMIRIELITIMVIIMINSLLINGDLLRYRKVPYRKTLRRQQRQATLLTEGHSLQLPNNNNNDNGGSDSAGDNSDINRNDDDINFIPIPSQPAAPAVPEQTFQPIQPQPQMPSRNERPQQQQQQQQQQRQQQPRKPNRQVTWASYATPTLYNWESNRINVIDTGDSRHESWNQPATYSGSAPGAYSWGYRWMDQFGNQMFREESSDGLGTVRGRYSYREASGILRIVEYIADQYGYRTRIRSNEPGIVTSNPAGAQIIRFEDENDIPE